MKKRRLMAFLLAAVLALEPGFGGAGAQVFAASDKSQTEAEIVTQAAEDEESVMPRITGVNLDRPEGTLYSDTDMYLQVDYRANTTVTSVEAEYQIEGQEDTISKGCEEELEPEGTATIDLNEDEEGQEIGNYKLVGLTITDADDNITTYTYDDTKQVFVNEDDETDTFKAEGCDYTISNFDGKGIVLTGSKLNLPEGTTVDALPAGTPFTVSFTLKNESDRAYDLELSGDYGAKAYWDYTSGEGEDEEVNPDGIETKDLSEDSGTLHLEPGQAKTLDLEVETNAYLDSGKATFSHLDLFESTEDILQYNGCRVTEGQLVSYIDGKEGPGVTYDQNLDFSVVKGAEEDLESPKITGISKNFEGPVYTGSAVTYNVDYTDDLSGVKDVNLDFTNDNGDVLELKGTVEENGSKEGTILVDKQLEEQPVGTYKLTEATITDHSDKQTSYTLNEDGSLLVGDDDEEGDDEEGDDETEEIPASTFKPDSFQVQYMEKALKITNLRFVTEDGKETQEYLTGDTARMQVTLKNDTDDEVYLNSRLLDAELNDNETYLGLSCEEGNEEGIFTIPAGAEKTLTFTEKLEEEQEGHTYHFTTVGTVSSEDEQFAAFSYEADKPDTMLYERNRVKVDLNVDKLSFAVANPVKKDKEAPFLTDVSVSDNLSVTEGLVTKMQIDLGIDADTLGAAEFTKADIELTDLENSKNVLKYNNLTVTKTAAGKYRTSVNVAGDTISGTYKVTAVKLTDANGNVRIYKLCENGKLGIDTPTGAIGSITAPETTIKNTGDPVEDFEGPVLKRVRCTDIQKDGDDVTGATFTVNADDVSGVSSAKLTVKNGETTYELEPQEIKETDGSYLVCYALKDKVTHYGTYTWASLALYDGTSRKNESIYTYNATEKQWEKDAEIIKGEGEDQFTIHEIKEYITKATTEKDGKIVVKCADPNCDLVKSETVIPYPEKVTLGNTKYVYNGSNRKPSVTVTGSDGKTISKDNYTVTYPEDCSEAGTYEATITFKGDYYEGVVTRSYEIEPQRPDTILNDMRFDTSELESKNILKVSVDATAKNGISRMDLRFPGEEDEVYILKPTDMGNDGDHYTFTYSTKELPVGENDLDGVLFYDETSAQTEIIYSYYYDEEEQTGYFDLEEGDFEFQTTTKNNLFFELHDYRENVDKARPHEDGYASIDCEECGDTKKEWDIPAPEKITLSPAAYIYNGKAQTPKVKVTGSDGKTIAASNYKVSYASGRKNIGRYTVTVQFIGKYYAGKMTKTFDITPKATKLSNVKAAKKAMTVKWKKQASQTSGYLVQYSQKSNFKSGNKTVTVSGNKKVSQKISKLKSKKTYYVRVCTYKSVKVGKKTVKICSGWSKAKKVKIK